MSLLKLKSLLRFTGALALGVFSITPLYANPTAIINEISAGLNGDSSIQFLELAISQDTDRQWGPKVNELVGRMMVSFHDPSGRQTGRFVFSSDALSGAKTILVASQKFADKFPSIIPDFVMPELIRPAAGKVCIRNNPDNNAYNVNHCLSYGGVLYTGPTESSDMASENELPTVNVLSLGRIRNFSSTLPLNSDY